MLFMSRPKRPAKCRICPNPVKDYVAVYCSNKCQLQSQHEAYIERWKAGLETGVVGAAAISKYIRRYFIDKYGEQCQRCGWQERNPVTGKVPLTIDHVDGDCLNNAESNLRLLCPNCHSLTANYGNLNRGKSQRYYRRAQATMKRILGDVISERT
jgi:5-methylcytosine-specific restriction endonuclease McrA